MVFKGFDVGIWKEIFENVEYDIDILREEGGEFLGLGIVLSDDSLFFIFRSDDDNFDYDISPWRIWLGKNFKKYKQGYLESDVVTEMIQIFKTYDLDNLKVVIDNDLSELKIIHNNKMILDCCIW